MLAGGIGGSVVANRLSENIFTSVLLIEAGPECVCQTIVAWAGTYLNIRSDDGELDLAIPANYPNSIPRRFHWNFTTTVQAGLGGRSIDYERGYVLGGSTSVSAYQSTRCRSNG